MGKNKMENKLNITEETIDSFDYSCKSIENKERLYGETVVFDMPQYDKLLRRVCDKGVVDEPVNAKNKAKIDAWILGLDIPMRVSNIVCGNAVVSFEISLSEEALDIESKAQVELSVKVNRRKMRLQFAKILQEHKSEIVVALGIDSDKVMIDSGENSNRPVAIQLPNTKNKEVCLYEMLQDESIYSALNNRATNTANCKFVIGKTVDGKNVITDFEHDPHLLIAGNAQEKNDFINSMLMSIICTSDPNYVRTILIDLEGNNLSNFKDIPHIYDAGVCTDIEEAEEILLWLMQEMEDRYTLFNITGCRSLEEYNEYAKAEDCMIEPRIVVIIPEIAPYMQQKKKDFEKCVAILAHKARLIGINLVIGSSQSTRDVFSGVIKSSCKSNITFKQNFAEESKTAFGAIGGENLLGNGDMLIYHQGVVDYERVQGCKVTQEEINKVTQDLFERNSGFESVYPRCELKNESDELFGKNDPCLKGAVRYAIIMKFINHGVLIRDFNLSIFRAKQLRDAMIEKGYVESEAMNGNRKVCVDRAMFEKEFGEDLYFKGDKH